MPNQPPTFLFFTMMPRPKAEKRRMTSKQPQEEDVQDNYKSILIITIQEYSRNLVC